MFSELSSSLLRSLRSTGYGLRFAPLLLLTPLASASLGGDLNSVMNDQIHFQGSIKTTETASFTVHEIHPQTGIVVREYVSAAGKVFAISWHGAWMPDMHQLLGSYFQQYSDGAKAQKTSYTGRRPLQIVQPDFVFQHGGHMRSYAGRTYLPQLLPAGVTAEDIQ
jgi:hypothetical protein